MTETLTPMQREVARLYEARWQPQTIAKRFKVSVRTVYEHAYKARKRGAAVPSARKAFGGGQQKVSYLTYASDFRAGLACPAIAAKHGVHISTVARALRILRAAGADIPPPHIGGRRPSGFGRPA